MIDNGFQKIKFQMDTCVTLEVDFHRVKEGLN